MSEVLDEVDLSSLDELWLDNDLKENVKVLVDRIISNNRWMPSSIISASQEIDNFSKNHLNWYDKSFLDTFKTRLLNVLLFTKTEVK